MRPNFTHSHREATRLANEPLYHQLYLRLKTLIRNGEYDVGEFLPTEEQLQREYDLSRTTVRKAISVLANEGYVEVTRGRGTQVLRFRHALFHGPAVQAPGGL